MTAANTSSFPRLMGDVGGTNARFALQEAPGAQPSQVRTYAVADHANIDGAMKAYLEQVVGPKPRQGAVGIANPIVGDFLRMTNSPWARLMTRIMPNTIASPALISARKAIMYRISRTTIAA